MMSLILSIVAIVLSANSLIFSIAAMIFLARSKDDK